MCVQESVLCADDLPIELVKWVASTGRFHFFIDGSGSQTTVQAKVTAVKEGGRADLPVFTSSIATLPYCLQAGASGICDITSTVHAELMGTNNNICVIFPFLI
jgi:hypothetical protein